jgi:hypothetical protein
METENKLPVGICKQAVMKLESAMADINEIAEDEDIDENQKQLFSSLAESTGTMIACIVNEVSAEMGEEEFVNEQIDMDEIQPWPENDTGDILEEEL